MQTIKTIVNDLALIGYHLNKDELVIHVFNRIGNDFNEINTAIWAIDLPITFKGVYRTFTSTLMKFF